MTERQHICIVTSIGAAVGAIAAYLFFTDRGSALRHELAPALDEFEHELNHLRSRFVRAAAVANEGWRTFNEAIGEGVPPAARSNPHQTIPF